MVCAAHGFTSQRWTDLVFHSSIALPMLLVPKMSMGVSLLHFTSPSRNGSQIGIFCLALTLTLKKK